MAKKKTRELIEPPTEGTISTKKIDEAVDDVLKEDSAKKKRAKKQPAKKTAKKKRSCRHVWKIVSVWTKSKKLMVSIQCEKCNLIVVCKEIDRFIPVAEIHSSFTF